MKYLFIVYTVFSTLNLFAQGDDPTERFFFKLDYGVTIPLGTFSESLELSDGYAVTGHGGSLSGGFHWNERWSIAVAVHNSLNKVEQVEPYDFNDRRHYQLFQVSLEPYYKFRTYPSVLYLKTILGIVSRATPWYSLSYGDQFLDRYIFVSPKRRVGAVYGIGGGVMFKTQRSARVLMEIQWTRTSAVFEVYQGDLLTGIREDVPKSMPLLSLKAGLFLSN